MCVVTEADAAAIREVYERDGELSAAIELRRGFPASSTTGAGTSDRRLDAATRAPSAALQVGVRGQGASLAKLVERAA